MISHDKMFFIRNFSGTRSSVEILKGYMQGCSQGRP